MRVVYARAAALSILWFCVALPGLAQSGSVGSWSVDPRGIQGGDNGAYGADLSPNGPPGRRGMGIDSPNQTFYAPLPEPNAERPPSGGVSVQELRHPPARKAVVLAAKALKLSSDGDHARAAEALEKAARTDPTYLAASINLGVQYTYLKRFEEAIAEFSRANRIAGPNPVALCDMAFADLQLRRREEALSALDACLKLDPYRPQAHYLLGAILAPDPRHHAEALRHLQLAAPSIPGARAMLQRVQTAPVMP